jgi:hypothetical protein
MLKKLLLLMQQQQQHCWQYRLPPQDFLHLLLRSPALATLEWQQPK